jgi:hypothetical protein
MCLDSGICRIVHEVKQSGDDSVVKLLFEDRREVGRHLSEGVAASKADSGMLEQKNLKMSIVLIVLMKNK